MASEFSPSKEFPAVLSRLHLLDFDYADGEGIDFEPYASFMSGEDCSRWFRAWTGNDEADGDRFLIFGQDGTGGYAAFWSHEHPASLLDRPIVFLGSEGAVGVVAKNLDDYLWLLASGHGPLEAVEYPDDDRAANAVFTAFAEEHAKSSKRTVSTLLSEAHAAYPGFTDWVRAQCR